MVVNNSLNKFNAPKKKEILGKVIFQRSDSDDCICCEGKHIFSIYVNWDKKENVHVAFTDDYIRGVLHSFIRNKEGKTIKLTIEELEDNSPVTSNRNESESHAFANVGASDKYVGRDTISTLSVMEVLNDVRERIQGCLTDTNKKKEQGMPQGMDWKAEALGYKTALECIKRTKEKFNLDASQSESEPKEEKSDHDKIGEILKKDYSKREKTE